MYIFNVYTLAYLNYASKYKKLLLPGESWTEGKEANKP